MSGGDDGEGGGRKALPATAYARTAKALDDLRTRPQLVVLALDQTVWPFVVRI